MKNLVIVLAAGAGERFKGHLSKQFQKIRGCTLLELCLETFQNHPRLDGIILICPAAQAARAKKIVFSGRFSKVVEILNGGETRQESSFIGVNAVPAIVENVLIHDAARPLVSRDIIDRVLAVLDENMAVSAAFPIADTIFRVGPGRVVEEIPDRSALWQAQTPQGFRLNTIKQAHDRARSEGYAGASDDCSLVLRYKLAPVVIVQGSASNIKITYPQDIAIAEAILKKMTSDA